MRIAIAGASGAVGRPVVAAATEAGHLPVALSRASGVDLMSPTGLTERLTGVDAVIDVSGPATIATGPAIEFFSTVTENLLAAERAAGVGHHVALSIIGAASANSGYYAGKAAQERMLAASSAPWSVLRASQFHEFAVQTASRPRVLGLHLVPVMRSQPIAAREVADELIRIAEGEPIGIATDLAGPRVELMGDMVARYLRATHGPGRVLSVPLPGSMGRVMRSGGLLPDGNAKLGRQTFAEWLAELPTS